MPSNTVNFSLPYPNGSDAPCDFAQQWCDFTDAINNVMAFFQAGIDRAIPVIPAALLRTSISRSIPDRNPIPFDEVVLDTAGMTDLDADPYRITIPRTGRYTVSAFISKQTNGVLTPSEIGLRAENELTLDFHVNASILDLGVAVTYYVPASTPALSLVSGDRVQIAVNSGTFVSQTIDSAWLAVIWHSDTEVPA